MHGVVARRPDARSILVERKGMGASAEREEPDEDRPS